MKFRVFDIVLLLLIVSGSSVMTIAPKLLAHFLRDRWDRLQVVQVGSDGVRSRDASESAARTRIEVDWVHGMWPHRSALGRSVDGDRLYLS